MIKLIFFHFVLILGLTSYSQKIKIKKGEIFINKLNVGSIEKIKSDEGNYFQIKNTENDIFCNVKQTSIPSILFKGNKEYPHRIIYQGKITDTITITEKNYWLNSKRSLEYLLKIGLLSPKGFHSEKINELVTNTPKYPAWIEKELKAEEALAKHIDFKISRKVNDSIILKELSPTETRGQLNRAPVLATRVNIFQKNGEDEILIGYAIHEVESISGYTYYYIFNTKNVPLSFFDTFKYKLYYPYQEFGLTKNKLRSIEGLQNIVSEMALDLIKTNKL